MIKSAFLKGFEKTASRHGPILPLASLAGAVSGGSIGAGLGLLLRAKLEDRHADKKNNFISKAPLILGATGAALGGVKGYRTAKHWLNYLDSSRHFSNPHTDIDAIRSLIKKGALKKEVKLRPHQEKAIQETINNGGSMLMAHATGTGKTLTGIAAFEELKRLGKAQRAIVVVPAGLRSNFIENGIKKFTDSSVSRYGPKNETGSKGVEDKSSSHYNVISYDLFREHADKIIENTKADTLIMDEVHRVRGTEGSTYNKLRDIRPKFQNAITLTGSVVNNQPNDVVPLLDITYGPTGHKLVSKDFFDKLFVKKDAKTHGLLNSKVYIEKTLKNKDQLSRYLGGKISYISHKDIEKDLPHRTLETVTVDMSPQQSKLYNFAMSDVDPVTRWKIRNNIPVGAKEAQEAFGKLMQARQIATDPAVLDKTLAGKDPYEYSSKVKAVVDDLQAHLAEDKKNKVVVYGNLITGQLDAVKTALNNKGISHSIFFGVGNEGSSAKLRDNAIKTFQEGKSKVLLISGAGAEGLDLKNATMLQMLEGHYNPEKIQQAEARVRRMGAPIDKVLVKRYVSRPRSGAIGKFLGKGDEGVDKWIYNIADKKDKLNSEFRGVLNKTAEYQMNDLLSSGQFSLPSMVGRNIGITLGEIPGGIISKKIEKNTDKEIEAKVKQMLLDRGYENLTEKKHYNKVLSKSKIDEKAIDARLGTQSLLAGISGMSMFYPGVRQKISDYSMQTASKIIPQSVKNSVSEAAFKLIPKMKNPQLQSLMRIAAPAFLGGLVTAAGIPIMSAYAKRAVIKGAIGGERDLDIGIKKYVEDLRKKNERKYKSSKSFINEYDTKKELGIDIV